MLTRVGHEEKNISSRERVTRIRRFDIIFALVDKGGCMGNVSIKKADYLLDEELMTPRFRRGYQVEYVKVFLTQQIAKMRKNSCLNQKALAERLGASL